MDKVARVVVALLGIAAMFALVVLFNEPATFFLSMFGGATLGVLWILWWIGDIV